MGTQSTLPPPSRAADLCKYFSLGEDAKEALQPEMTPDQFLQVLAENKWFGDAVQFLAHYLPKRQAVFWAMTCVKQSGATTTPHGDAALKATEKWIAASNEENRQATLNAANDADTSTAAGATALAAYYSDGLPQTQDAKSNAKAYFMTAKLSGGAVLMAAVADREQVLARLESFVNKGIEIARKTHQR
jgi:hypothetical protein